MNESLLSKQSKSNIFESMSYVALVSTIVLTVFLFIPLPGVPFYHTKVTIFAFGIAVSLLLFAVGRLSRGALQLPPLLLLLSFWLIGLGTLLSALFSGLPLATTLYGIELETTTLGFVLLLLVATTLTACIFRKPIHFLKAGHTFLIAFFVFLCAQVGVFIYSLIDSSYLLPSTNFVGTPADFAHMLGLLIIIALVILRFASLTPFIRIATIIATCVALFFAMLQNMIIIWVPIGLVSLLFVGESVLFRKSSKASLPDENVGRKLFFLPLCLVLASVFFFATTQTFVTDVANMFDTNSVEVRPSLSATFDIAAHTYASAPLFGTGPGTFKEMWLSHRDPLINENEYFWNIDFDFGVGYLPTVLVTQGVVGTIMWFIPLLLFLLVGVRSLVLPRQKEPSVRLYTIISYVTALYTFSLAIFAVTGPAQLVLGFFALGVYISLLRFGEQSHETVIVFNKNPKLGLFLVFVFTLCIVVALATAYSVSTRYIASVAYLNASNALKVNRITEAEKYLQTALTFDPNDRVYRLAALTGVASMNELAGNTTIAPDELQSQFQVLLTQSIEFAVAATQENPRNYENFITLAAVYQSVVPLRVDGAYDKALEAYDQAISLNPSSPATRVLLAQLELSRNDLERAEARLLEAIGLKRNYLQAVLLLARLKIETGKTAEALEVTERALVIAKTDEVSLFQIAVYKLGAGDIRNANSLFSRITELNPQYANAHYFVGVTYALLGEFDEAVSALSRVKDLAPENAETVGADIASLNEGVNPFTTGKLRELGVPGVAPVPAETTEE